MNEDKLGTFLLKITRHSDIAMAFLVVAIIGLIVLPLPTFIVDTLIAVNLAVAVSLLMISLYIPSALSLSTFPSLLLFTTLFRLALNITTTRQILLYAYAGQIIDTFGNIVVAGNLIVGSVVFLIITLVQFLVIAKGSERVAEVGARFTLDAMPGKQMSIDADMRAGTIDMDTARHLRGLLAKESQLYGAMDGAMKFVKNDAIAGLLVTAVNIFGGVAVGMLQKNMDAYTALETFSILTIGDGLISQIPALFISITAGIIVTRVGGGGNHLGGEIGDQVLNQPKALAVGGVVLLFFVLVPGFPKIQFLVLSFLVGGAGLLLHRRAQTEKASKEAGQPQTGKAERMALFAPAAPLALVLPSTTMTEWSEELLSVVGKVGNNLYQSLGVPLPEMVLAKDDAFPPGKVMILLQDTPLAEIDWNPETLMVFTREIDLQLLSLPYLPSLHSGVQKVDQKHRQALQSSNLAFLEPPDALVYLTTEVMKKHAAEFVGMQETQMILDSMEQKYNVLVKEVLRVLPLAKLTDVLKRLVSEDLSIRDLRTILEAVINWAPKEKDVVLLTEYVRMGLSRQICHKYSDNQGLVAGYLFDPTVEETVRKAIRQTGTGSYLALDPQISRQLMNNIKVKLGAYKDASEPPVLISSMDIRRYIKKLVEAELVDLSVLSFQELGNGVTVTPLARIGLAN